MRKRIIVSMLLLAAATFTFSLNEANAGLPLPPLPPLPGVNVHVNGYLPAPPGVHVLIDSGRPYYVEREQRVYIERERPVKHYKKKHYKKRKHHDDHGNRHGHGK